MRGFTLFLCALLAPSVLWAQPRKLEKDDLKKAEELFLEAERHYHVGEYEVALEKYKESYLISGLPELLFNFGQCQRKLGRYDEALKSYRTYLQSLPDDGGSRAAVEKIIRDTEAERARVQSGAPGGAPASGPAAALERPASPLPWLAGAGAGAALGLALGGLSFSAAARSAAAAEVPLGVQPDFSEIAAQRRKAFLLASLSTASFVAAAASGGLGVVLSRRAKRIEARAALSPGGVTLSVRY